MSGSKDLTDLTESKDLKELKDLKDLTDLSESKELTELTETYEETSEHENPHDTPRENEIPAYARPGEFDFKSLKHTPSFKSLKKAINKTRKRLGVPLKDNALKEPPFSNPDWPDDVRSGLERERQKYARWFTSFDFQDHYNPYKLMYFMHDGVANERKDFEMLIKDHPEFSELKKITKWFYKKSQTMVTYNQSLEDLFKLKNSPVKKSQQVYFDFCYLDETLWESAEPWIRLMFPVDYEQLPDWEVFMRTIQYNADERYRRGTPQLDFETLKNAEGANSDDEKGPDYIENESSLDSELVDTGLFHDDRPFIKATKDREAFKDVAKKDKKLRERLGVIEESKKGRQKKKDALDIKLTRKKKTRLYLRKKDKKDPDSDKRDN